MQLRRAERKRQHLRIALCSPAGGGKTFTALRIAHALGGPVGVVDTENGSSELYAGERNPDGGVFDFLTADLSQEPGKYSVDNYIRALYAMHSAGVRTVIVDSGTHAWSGEGGVLSVVDEAARRSKSKNTYVAWAEGTPQHLAFVQALLSYPGHLILTLRQKVEYVQEKNDKGHTEIRKVGMAPIQRDGLDYEMTVVGDLEADTHRLIVTKTRCSALADRSFVKPGADVARVLLDWLDGGADPEPVKVPEPTPEHVKTAAEVKADRAAADAARKAAHHPSWSADHRQFAAEVAKLKLDVGIVMDLGPHSPQGKRPSQLTQIDRIEYFRWLQTDAGRAAYDALKAERGAA